VRELSPKDVLIDLFGGADFDHEAKNQPKKTKIIG
jgi:hypothetical protein